MPSKKRESNTGKRSSNKPKTTKKSSLTEEESINEFYRLLLKESNLDELTYKGRPISTEFDNMVREAAEAAHKNPQDILDNPKYSKTIDALLEKHKATLFRKSNTIFKFLKESGKKEVTVTDGEKSKVVPVDEAIKYIIRYEQESKKDREIVYLGIKTVQYLNGEFKIFVPAFGPEKGEPAHEYFARFMDSDNSEYLEYHK